jgi:hypothetical protein
VFTTDLHKPSIQLDEGAPDPATATAQPSQDVMPVEPDRRWPFIDHLLHEWLPEDQAEAHCLARRAKSFIMQNGELYHRSASDILQWCISLVEGKTLLFGIHKGVCSHHAVPQSFVGKAFRQGFYWSTAVSDAKSIVHSCQGCQYFTQQTHVPAQELQNIPITWSFAVWGIDLLGPFARAPGATPTCLSLSTNSPSGSRPLGSITTGQAKNFLKDIVFRFRVLTRLPPLTLPPQLSPRSSASNFGARNWVLANSGHDTTADAPPIRRPVTSFTRCTVAVHSKTCDPD